MGCAGAQLRPSRSQPSRGHLQAPAPSPLACLRPCRQPPPPPPLGHGPASPAAPSRLPRGPAPAPPRPRPSLAAPPRPRPSGFQAGKLRRFAPALLHLLPPAHTTSLRSFCRHLPLYSVAVPTHSCLLLLCSVTQCAGLRAEQRLLVGSGLSCSAGARQHLEGAGQACPARG